MDLLKYYFRRSDKTDLKGILEDCEEQFRLGAKKGLLEACDAQRVDGKNKDLVHPEQFAIVRKRSEPVSLPGRIKRKLLKCSRTFLKGGSSL